MALIVLPDKCLTQTRDEIPYRIKTEILKWLKANKINYIEQEITELPSPENSFARVVNVLDGNGIKIKVIRNAIRINNKEDAILFKLIWC